MNKTLNNYFYKVGLLLMPTLCINFTHKIVYCALLFTLLTFILNCIAKYHGSKKATMSIVLCTVISLSLLHNKPYYISGKLISGLILASLSAIFIASYAGFKLFLKLEAKYGFILSNYISLCISAFVDHLMMGIFFTSALPMHKICLILYKETIYTCLFATILYMCSVVYIHVYTKLDYIRIKRHLRRLVSIGHIKFNTCLYKKP